VSKKSREEGPRDSKSKLTMKKEIFLESAMVSSKLTDKLKTLNNQPTVRS